MEVSDQHHAPAALPPEITQVPIVEDAGWAPETIWVIWSREKYVASAGIQTPDRPALA